MNVSLHEQVLVEDDSLCRLNKAKLAKRANFRMLVEKVSTTPIPRKTRTREFNESLYAPTKPLDRKTRNPESLNSKTSSNTKSQNPITLQP